MDEKAQIQSIEGLEDGNGMKSRFTHVEGNALLVNRHGEVRLLPVPSTDPNDPLNFPKWMKAGSVVSCAWFGESLHAST
jgi:hypothetical protein